MARADTLAAYNAKRDFAKTAEPRGTAAAAGGNRFVVQKHDATRLHWDFRLEIDGVLKSWAVTRGPSLDPAEKRLAVRTEDHPLSYADFEGTIPPGEYGGGTVMLWDSGTWEPVPGKSAGDLASGHLHFVLHGTRMKGEWLLIRLKPRGRDKRENWLLRKIDDVEAGGTDALVETGLTSVKTGRTMREIAEGAKAAKADPPPTRRGRRKVAADAPPGFRPVQLATLVDDVPRGDQWLHEVKYDGYRALLAVGGGAARVYTRSGLDWSERFPGIVRAARALPVPSALIDGEVVAFKQGRPDFSTLQQVLREGGEGLTYFAFDLLALDGEDMTRLPNVQRKERLRPLVEGAGDAIRYAEHVLGNGARLLGTLCHEDYEGVVSKRVDAPYRGERTRDWLKSKCTRRQEFVVIGWLPSQAKGRPLRSLLLAVHGSGGLRYAGRVGTGFDADTMHALRDRLERIARKTPPAEVPPAAARGARWVTPKLVAEVAFAEFTADDVVRHARFLGLREDKDAKDVVAEEPAAMPEPEEPKGRITHPDRVVFPDDGLTKGMLADYYARLAPAMLPWIARRPISLVRCPDGIAGQCFFQKHDSGSFGAAIHHVDIREKDGGVEPYLWVDSAEGIRACVQMGTIEFHGWGSRIDDLERPDRMVFDLDPDAGLDFEAVKKAAEEIRGQLADIGLASHAMLTGGKGVHVVVPLVPDAEWPAVRSFAERFARALAQAQPERYTAHLQKAKRTGRVFIDYLRNQRGSTAVLPYVVRARPGAAVATPVGWSELRDLDSARAFRLGDADTLIERADSRALRGWGEAEQRLPDL